MEEKKEEINAYFYFIFADVLCSWLIVLGINSYRRSLMERIKLLLASQRVLLVSNIPLFPPSSPIYHINFILRTCC
jgi:hypothetical protein